jgi:hypothetical protein
MKQTILIASLAHLLITGSVYADQRTDEQARPDNPQMQHQQQTHRYPAPVFDRPPVIIKLLQRKGADDRIRTYHT